MCKTQSYLKMLFNMMAVKVRSSIIKVSTKLVLFIAFNHKSSTLFLLVYFYWTIEDLELTLWDAAYTCTSENVLVVWIFTVCFEKTAVDRNGFRTGMLALNFEECSSWLVFCWWLGSAKYTGHLKLVLFACRFLCPLSWATKISGVLASNSLEILVFLTEWLLNFPPSRWRPAFSAALLRNLLIRPEFSAALLRKLLISFLPRGDFIYQMLLFWWRFPIPMSDSNKKRRVCSIHFDWT